MEAAILKWQEKGHLLPLVEWRWTTGQKTRIFKENLDHSNKIEVSEMPESNIREIIILGDLFASLGVTKTI